MADGNAPHTLILGGARSGKSTLAERLATASGQAVTYIATATPEDAEMAERIAHHQARRPRHWQLVEEPLALAATLEWHAEAGKLLLVECLTLWLSNLLRHADPTCLVSQRQALLETLPRLPGRVLLVGNAVGMGIVPMTPLGRRFVDESGRLHQALAALCGQVVFVAAGLPLMLKGSLDNG